MCGLCPYSNKRECVQLPTHPTYYVVNYIEQHVVLGQFVISVYAVEVPVVKSGISCTSLIRSLLYLYKFHPTDLVQDVNALSYAIV